MNKTVRKEIKKKYPEVLSLEHIRCILHISKRKAAWMLQNRIIECENNGRKTRQYKVKMASHKKTYLMLSFQYRPFLLTPCGTVTYISLTVLAFRNEKDKQNQGLMTHHQAGVGIDDLPPAFGVKLLELFIKI